MHDLSTNAMVDTERWKLGLWSTVALPGGSDLNINIVTYTPFLLKHIVYLVSGMLYSLDFPPSWDFLLVPPLSKL